MSQNDGKNAGIVSSAWTDSSSCTLFLCLFVPTRKQSTSCKFLIGQWSSRHSGQPRTAGPSDDGLKFGQFAGIVQTCSDLVAREIGKFRDNVFS